MTNPIGLMIQAQDGRVDRVKLYAHVRAAQYGTVTVLDNFDVAAQITRDLPDCIVLLRYYKEEEWNPGKETAVEHFHRRRSEWQAIIDAGLQDHVFLTIDCESPMTQVRCDGYADMIEEAVKVGVGLALGGNSSGSVLSGWGEPNGWYAIGRRLLVTLAKYKGFKRYFLRHHHYTTYYMWAVSNGLAPSHENARWEKRPQKIDWSLPQWHIGRDCYGVMKTCDALGLAYPWTIIDETGLDDMADIQGRIPNIKLDGSDKAGGWHTLETQLHEWYGIEAGEAYANMLIWAWETVYKPLGFVIGMHVFTYGDASPVEIRRFEKFRVENSAPYLRRMESYSEVPAPVPAPEPVPIPPPPAPAPMPVGDNWPLIGLLVGGILVVLIYFFTRNTPSAQEVGTMDFTQLLDFVGKYGALLAGAMEILKALILQPLFLRGLEKDTPEQVAAREQRYRIVVMGIAAALGLLVSVILHLADSTLNVLTPFGIAADVRPLSILLLWPGLVLGNEVVHEMYNIITRARTWIEAAADLKIAEAEAATGS